MEKVTVDTILDTLKEYVESKHPIAPTLFLDAGIKLIALMSDETDKLIKLQQEVAQLKVILFDDQDKSAAEIKVRIEATPQYGQMKKQEAKVKQINEFVMMAKKYATIKAQEYGQ